MDCPTHYSDISQKALDVQKEYSLTDIQTHLYNHICRGDFKLRNGDGQSFYDPDHEGFGYHDDRNWVKRQFSKLIRKKLVNFTSLHDCRDGKYTSWYFWDPTYELDDLIDASCYVSTHKIAMIKHYLNLPDGFEKRNKTYGDLELIYNENRATLPIINPFKYTFKYKGEGSIYGWDMDGQGIKKDLTDITGHFTFDSPIWYESFQEMCHPIWSFLAHDGYEYKDVPGYHTYRLS